jgi:hypothetical protein
MARRAHTYAIRLAVEGGGQVKPELGSVGQRGGQSRPIPVCRLSPRPRHGLTRAKSEAFRSAFW